MLARLWFASLVLAACAPTPPPLSPGLAPPSRPPPAPAPAPQASASPAAAPTIAPGTLRIDGASTDCPAIVGVEPDGSATLLCTFERENGCALRHLGPDGEQTSRSDLAPGACVKWAPRPGGGGFLVSRSDDYRSFSITSLDASGKRIASGGLSSQEEVIPLDATVAADGGVVISLEYRKDLLFAKRRLGTTKFSTSGIVKLAPALDRLAWSRLFETRRTRIAGLLPATRGGVDALVTTRGPLVPGAPVNPPVNPADGSIYGGDTYGWKAERVSLDARGAPVARIAAAVEAGRIVSDAAQVGDAIAALTIGVAPTYRMNLTVARSGAQPERSELAGGYTEFVESGGRTWLIDCDCKFDQGRQTGTWTATELGGAGMKVALGGAFGVSTRWRSIAVTADRIAAVGTTNDPVTGMPLTFAAIAKLPSGSPALDAGRLRVSDHLALAPACRKARASLPSVVSGPAGKAFDAPLEACGVPPKATVQISTYVDGGIRSFTIGGASPEVTACARRVYEPVTACPLENTSVTFTVRLADGR